MISQGFAQDQCSRAIGIVARTATNQLRPNTIIKRPRGGIVFRNLQKEFCCPAPQGFRQQRLQQNAPNPLPPRPWPPLA